ENAERPGYVNPATSKNCTDSIDESANRNRLTLHNKNSRRVAKPKGSPFQRLLNSTKTPSHL
ncbi:Hypothetical predicted protein, partial [Pelobates cultripes]